MNIPEELHQFEERLREMLPDEADSILASYTHGRDVAFRINTLVTSEQEILDVLIHNAIPFREVEGFAASYTVDPSERKKLLSLSIWKEGKIVVQSLSSQLVSLILDPKPNQLILDACASPGSKTSHLAALMQNTGNIVANDASWARVGKLKDVCSKLHVTNVVFVNMPAEILWRDYEQTFDHALVDVPCTMEGRIDFNDPDSYADWSVKKIKRLSMEQKGILRSVVRCVKPGGTIVYSTCTLAPEENEEVIDWLLEKEENLRVEPLQLSTVPHRTGIKEWHGKKYSDQIDNCVRVLPTAEWEGFFVTKLTKYA